MRSTSLFCRMLACSLIFGAAIGLLVRTSAATDDPKTDDPSPKQILDRMEKTYADCKTYRDSGVVKTVFVSDTDNHTVEKPFTTAFVRPGQFRFEYRDSGVDQSRYIVWSNGQDVQTKWEYIKRIEKPESLDRALAGATGVSGASAHNVPALLLPDKVTGRRLTQITNAKRAEDGKVGVVECFRVEGKLGDVPITLWIDKKSYLLRRIDDQMKFDKFRTEQTTTYDPIIDEKVSDKLLEFDPPVPK